MNREKLRHVIFRDRLTKTGPVDRGPLWTARLIVALKRDCTSIGYSGMALKRDWTSIGYSGMALKRDCTSIGYSGMGVLHIGPVLGIQVCKYPYPYPAMLGYSGMGMNGY